ncbi:MAG TPA: AAA family ATPase [Gammaproteobacteria bacterium]|nr:AAA family ATPase [Gammaproteobacteria bacterium]
MFKFYIENDSGQKEFEIETGSSLFFVGANGSGKTRLAAKIEEQLELNAHRISAHRALNLNPGVAKISELGASSLLRTGSQVGDIRHRPSGRWANKSPTALLNDYDALIQLLFAEQCNRTLDTHNKNQAGDTSKAPSTKFETLKNIWEKLIPHRKLEITGDDIKILIADGIPKYNAEDMSDGERAIFYLIGQTLCAKENSILIVDEPELHIHRSIMSKLWDELESVRADCGFIFVSHDLEFVAGRVGKKYIIRDFNSPKTWVFDEVPDDTGFSEETITQILGSRRSVLFVEGENSSLDLAIYRNCYPEWTVMPRGSCKDVIFAVATMRNNQALTRISCLGIVDLDDHSQADIEYLKELGIEVLPVSEIENLFILPEIIRAIGNHEGYSEAEIDAIIQSVANEVFENINYKNNLEDSVVRYCIRRVDRILCKINFSTSKNVSDLYSDYSKKTAAINIQDIADSRRKALRECIAKRDLDCLASLYDNKGLVSIVSSKIRGSKSPSFQSWIVRILGNSVPIRGAFKKILPQI